MVGSDADRRRIAVAEQPAIGAFGDRAITFPGAFAARLVTEVLDLDVTEPMLETGSTHAAKVGEVRGEWKEPILGIRNHHAGIERVLDPT